MNEIEIRVIGTAEQLENVAKAIGAAYEIDYESGLYPCRKDPEKSRKYFKIREKEMIMKNDNDYKT